MQAIIELYFTPGGVLVLVMVVGDWFRIAQVSHMPFWEGQFVFVKHILEGGRLLGPYKRRTSHGSQDALREKLIDYRKLEGARRL